jgi:SSS family solute:Na+ symporter
MDRVGLVFILCMVLAIVVSLIENKGHHENAVDLESINFESSKGYNISTVAVILILIGFYITWW